MASDTSAEYDRFTSLVDQVIAVPRDVIKKRMDQYDREAAKNPNRPGPKPKVKKSASGRASRAKG